MKKVAVIGESQFVRFFELIGAVGFTANTPDEVKKKVKELIEKGEYAIIILSERFLDAVKPIKNKLIEEEKVEPVFVFLPDFVEISEKRVEELKRDIMYAIGIEFQL